MLNTFQENDKTAARRRERERQLALMNHAANGTGPFASEDASHWDVDVDMMDLQLPAGMTGAGMMGGEASPTSASGGALASAAFQDHPTSASSLGSGTGENSGAPAGMPNSEPRAGGRSADGAMASALDPARARAAALAALEAADRATTPGRRGSGNTPPNASGSNSNSMSTRASRFLWTDKDANRTDGGINDGSAERSVLKRPVSFANRNNHQANVGGGGHQFTIEEMHGDEDEEDPYRFIQHRGVCGTIFAPCAAFCCDNRTGCITVGGRTLTRRTVVFALVAMACFLSIIAGAASAKKPRNKTVAQGQAGGGAVSVGDNEPQQPVEALPVHSKTYDVYHHILVENGITPRSVLSNEETPQAKALAWMASHHREDDTLLELEEGDPLTEEEQQQLEDSGEFHFPIAIHHVLNKYGLVVLYYTSIMNSDGFDGKDESRGHNYGNRTYDYIANEDGASYTSRGTEWLSGYQNDEDETGDGDDMVLQSIVDDMDEDGYPSYCHWIGVLCHDPSGNPKFALPKRWRGSVKELNLTARGLVGTIPEELPVTLHAMNVLDLGYNHMEGTIPTTIGHATNLEQLYLGGNKLTGPIPSEIGKLNKVEDLYMHSNELTGQIPHEIGNLTALEGLGLYENTLNGTIPRTIGNLDNLFVLYLDDNALSGNLPWTIRKMSKLADARFRKNLLEGPLPPVISGMQSIEILYLDENDLTGEIPSTIAQLSYLKQLHLYKNNLNGSLPTELAQLNSLELLYLDNNQLTGNIPTEYGALSSLEALYLFDNNMGGEIPPELGLLENLRSLRVNNNAFTGAIPSEIGNMVSLELLYVNSNSLAGFVPKELGHLAELEQLRINDNNLEGTVPRLLCQLPLVEFIADCAGNNPQITCHCCACER